MVQRRPGAPHPVSKRKKRKIYFLVAFLAGLATLALTSFLAGLAFAGDLAGVLTAFAGDFLAGLFFAGVFFVGVLTTLRAFAVLGFAAFTVLVTLVLVTVLVTLVVVALAILQIPKDKQTVRCRARLGVMQVKHTIVG